MKIKTVLDFDKALGQKYIDGGYPTYFIRDDGEELCHNCAHEEENLIRQAITDNDTTSEWLVTGYDVNYEDEDLNCCHCGQQIGSAYADTEEAPQCVKCHDNYINRYVDRKPLVGGPCPDCEVIMVNGVRTHEHGCPSAWKERKIECKWCGTKFIPEEQSQRFCSEDCQEAYNN